MPTGAGSLRERVAFQARSVEDDGYGNTVTGDFANVFTAAASYTYLRGGESVMAARLSSKQPIVVRVRTCAAARAVTTDYRIKDTRTNIVMNIRTIAPTVDGFIDFLTEAGEVAT